MSESLQIDFHPDFRLAVGRPVGTLDAELAKQLLIFLLALEDTHPEPFDRLLDLTGIFEVRLSGPQVYEFGRMRRSAVAGRAPFRTAIVANNPLTQGTARIYEVLMEDSKIKVNVFSDARLASEWLHVPNEIVQPEFGGARSSHQAGKDTPRGS